MVSKLLQHTYWYGTKAAVINIMKKTLRYIIVSLLCFLFGVISTYLVLERYDKERSRAALYVGSQYYEKKDFDMAAALLNQSLAYNASNYAPYHLLAEIYLAQDKRCLALKMFKLALERINSDVISPDKLRIEEMVRNLAQACDESEKEISSSQ